MKTRKANDVIDFSFFQVFESLEFSTHLESFLSPPFYLSRHDHSHENTFWHILPKDNRKIMFRTFLLHRDLWTLLKKLSTEGHWHFLKGFYTENKIPKRYWIFKGENSKKNIFSAKIQTDFFYKFVRSRIFALFVLPLLTQLFS